MFLPLLAFTTISLSSPVALNADVEELLARMRTMYSSPTTARLEVSVRQAVEGGFGEYILKFDYAKSNKVRAEVVRNNKVEFSSVSDGSKIAILDANGAAVETKDWDFEAMAQAVPGNLETLSFFDWNRQLSTAEGANMHDNTLTITKDEFWNDKTWMVLEEIAPRSGVIVKYFIEKETSLIWRTLVRSIEGSRLLQDCQVLRMERGIEIDPNRFVVPKS